MRSRLLLTVSAVALNLVVIALPAGAQDASEEVVVIGSRAGGRTDFESTVPVAAFDKQAIEHAATLPGEFGATLAASAATFDFPRVSNDGAADAVRAGQLRGLKPDETLVLINGKRAHTSSVFIVEGGNGLYTAPFDFNTIPTNAIARAEVLVDGAGAQYGSDAVAGVVNVVLDKSVGGQVSFQYGQYHTNFKPIGQTLDDGNTYSIDADYGWALGDRGFLHVGLEGLHRVGSNRAGYTQDANGVRGAIPWEANPYLPNSSQNDAVALAGRVASAGDGPAEGLSGFFNGEYRLTGDWTAYAFGTTSYRESKGDAFFRWPADWGGNGPDGNRNPGPVYPNGYRPVTKGASTDFQLTAGAKGDLFGWASDFSVSTGANFFDWGVSNSLNPSYGADSPKRFHLYGSEFLQTTVNADFVRSFALGTFEPVNVAAGGEYRVEHFATTPGDAASYSSGPLVEPVGAEAGPGLDPRDTASLTRNAFGFYVDISDQVIRGVTLDAAGRYDYYDDFGGKLNGKISSRVQLLDWLAVRASASTNYRAPSLAQLGSQTSSQLFSDTVSSGLVTTITAAPSGPIAKALGFSNLKPETSTNYSAGLVASYGPFRASFDVFEIYVHDGLTVYPTITSDAVSAYLKSTTGRDIQAVTLLQNLDSYKREGYDLGLGYKADLFDGAFDTGLNLTSGRFYTGTPKFTVPAVLTNLGWTPPGYSTTVYGYNLSKLVTHATWSNDDWTFVLRGTRWGDEYVAIYGTSDWQRFNAKWTFDLEVSKKLIGNLDLSVGANNIFDTYPDRQTYDNTYYGSLPYNSVQQGFQGAFYYARIKYALE